MISGIFAVFKIRRQLAGSAGATGKIFGFGRVAGRRGYLYCPQVEFSVPGGQLFKFQSKFGSQPASYAVGQQVKVVYQTGDPNQAEIDSVTALWFAPGCTILMALLFSVLGLMLFGIGLLVEFSK